jgi:hypothetical protein
MKRSAPPVEMTGRAEWERVEHLRIAVAIAAGHHEEVRAILGRLRNPDPKTSSNRGIRPRLSRRAA